MYTVLILYLDLNLYCWKCWRFIIDFVVVVITWIPCVFDGWLVYFLLSLSILLSCRYTNNCYFSFLFPCLKSMGHISWFGFVPKMKQTDVLFSFVSRMEMIFWLRIFHFFLFRFRFQSAICDLLFNLYLFFIAHKTWRHSIIIIITFIAKHFLDFGFMIIYSAELVHNGFQLW